MQKKILPTIFICLMVTAANAQIKKGAVLLGGQFGFNSQNSKSDFQNTETNATGFTVSPAFGKAIKENLVMGGDISFAYNKNETSNTYTQKSYAYGAGFFVRKYSNLGKDFYLFIQSRLGAGFGNGTGTDALQPANSSKSNGYTVQLAMYPGIAYSLSKKIQLEGGLNNLGYIQFNHSKQTSVGANESSRTNGFSLGSNLSNFGGLTVGFRVLLN